MTPAQRQIPPAIETVRQAYRYVFGSGLTLATSLSVTAFCHEILGLEEQASYGIALVIAFFVAFHLMRHYVCKVGEGYFWRQMRGFFVSALIFRPLEYISFGLIYEALGFHYLFTVILVNGTSFVLKFFYYKTLVFTTPEISAPRPAPETEIRPAPERPANQTGETR